MAQGRCRVRLVEQYIATYNCIKSLVRQKLLEVCGLKRHPGGTPQLHSALPCPVKCQRIPIQSKDTAAWSDNIRCKERDIANAGAQIQDMHPGLQSRGTKEPFGVWAQNPGLKHQALLFIRGLTQNVVGRNARHTIPDFAMARIGALPSEMILLELLYTRTTLDVERIRALRSHPHRPIPGSRCLIFRRCSASVEVTRLPPDRHQQPCGTGTGPGAFQYRNGIAAELDP
jgi:hypothetical protein